MKELGIVYKDINDIIPYENNPRHNDDAVDYVANSIKEFGFKVPIIIDNENVIVTGHTRLKAAIKLGLKEVPCIMADDLNEDQIKAFRLADNKVAEYSSWDFSKLGIELKEIDMNMNDFGFPMEIEDIDIRDSGEIEQSEEKIASELGEMNDYVVLEIKTTKDWERACRLLGVERCATGEDNPKIRRHGFGRVIDGKQVLDRLEELDED